MFCFVFLSCYSVLGDFVWFFLFFCYHFVVFLGLWFRVFSSGFWVFDVMFACLGFFFFLNVWLLGFFELCRGLVSGFLVGCFGDWALNFVGF
jgi:hypothetical protein